jgi:hypothetical protein
MERGATRGWLPWGRGRVSGFELVETTPANLRVRSDFSAAALRFGTHVDLKIRGGQVGCFFRPLDHAYGFRIEIFPEAGFFQFPRIKEPIKIKVIQV